VADLFGAPTIGMVRRYDPNTSEKAAASILPRRETIRQQVEAFALACGADGFIDEQLEREWPHRAGSTLRTRRSELAREMIVIDTGKTRHNSTAREMIVWVHRDHHPSPPPKRKVEPPISKADQIVRLEAQVRGLKRLLDEHNIAY
jgi:hypothetical protein